MVLKKIIILYLSLILLIPIMDVYAITGDAELVLEDIGIDPANPLDGDVVSITADVYNVGSKNTDLFASMVTAAYFVDGNLLHVGEVGNVDPGASNKITITSPPVWKYESGNHEIKVIVDYHDTLNDQYDSPADNLMNKILSVTNTKNTQISLDASPQYSFSGERTSKINISLFDSVSYESLNDKKIILTFDGDDSVLFTDHRGLVSFSNTWNSFDPVNIGVSFDGDDVYSPSYSFLTLYKFPSGVSSSLVLKLPDFESYDFENNNFDIVIYENSYEKLIKKMQPHPDMLFDSKTFWISLPPGNSYFAEIYLNGRIFSVTDMNLLQENSVIVEKIKIPEMGKIKFVVTDETNQLVTNSTITNWIYTHSANTGFTDWMDVIPAVKEPYVASVILPDESIVKSEPFLVFPGERKIVEITTTDTLIPYKIPSWIKNNAGWWADGLIDDSSFVEGMQFLIKEDMILIQSTTSDVDGHISEIPSWIKNNAGWWADGLIDDSSFVEGMQFLIKDGLIRVS